MTTQDKNIAIAEMLGWKKYNGLNLKWNNSFETNLTATAFDKVVTLLKFDTDANWQFEALDYIEKLEHSDWFYEFMMIESNNISIRARSKKDGSNDFEWFSVFQKGYRNWTRKEAIFEALYQFSQYLKTKK